ncbi:hypothetical protein LJC32_06490 [Oscillospiraceae bacterium OttesenSCG-928-F05]|nr:hypothetical protein [Oscillospiraceae bacterium OttesenSCG-928-F05]
MDISIKERFNTECARMHATDDPALRRQVWEYVEAVDCAPAFTKADPADRYKLLAEYGNHVLCGRDDGPTHGFTFVTWRKAYGGESVELGHYTGDYRAAKQDFALRAGLVRENLLFEKEQYSLLLEAVSLQRRMDDLLTQEQDRQLRDMQGQLEHICEDYGIVLGAPEQAQEPTMEMEGMS